MRTKGSVSHLMSEYARVIQGREFAGGESFLMRRRETGNKRSRSGCLRNKEDAALRME